MGLPLRKDILKKEVESLPEEFAGEVIDFIGYIKLKNGIYESDDEYIRSIPGLEKEIIEAGKEDIKDCVKLEDVDW